MTRTRLFGFGLLAAAGCVSVTGCSSDSPQNAGTADAASGGSASGGKTGGTGGAGTGGKSATGGAGGAATGGSGTGGAATGGSGTGGATSDASAGGTTSDASAGGTTSDASAPDGSGTGGTTNDAGTPEGSTPDAGTADTGAGGTSSSVQTCGTGPYARLWVGGSSTLGHPTGPISVSGSACPGTTLSLTPQQPATGPGKTGLDAQFLDVPDKAPVHLRATQTGSFPLLTQEVLPDSTSTLSQAFKFAALVNTSMVATDSGFDALDPSWNASTRAILLLQVAPLQGATGSCADPTGITVTVDGHSEATGKTGATPIVTAAGTYGTYVFVTTTGTAAAPELLTLTLTKAGCTVKTTGYEASPGLQTSLTGKYPVEAGAVTWGLAAITN
jgi:hypothetical protein